MTCGGPEIRDESAGRSRSLFRRDGSQLPLADAGGRLIALRRSDEDRRFSERLSVSVKDEDFGGGLVDDHIG